MGPPTGEQAKATPPEAVVATGPPHADPASQAERESCAGDGSGPGCPAGGSGLARHPVGLEGSTPHSLRLVPSEKQAQKSGDLPVLLSPGAMAEEVVLAGGCGLWVSVLLATWSGHRAAVCSASRRRHAHFIDEEAEAGETREPLRPPSQEGAESKPEHQPPRPELVLHLVPQAWSKSPGLGALPSRP